MLALEPKVWRTCFVVVFTSVYVCVGGAFRSHLSPTIRGPGTQVARLGGKCLLLLSGLTASKISFTAAVYVLLLVEISLCCFSLLESSLPGNDLQFW